MSVNEELQEHAEHAHDSFSRRAGASMAIIAAALAVVSVWGHVMVTEELVAQMKASDQWAFYQAKSQRRYQSEVAQDLLRGMGGEAAAKSVETYKANKERYAKEGEAIKEHAEEFEKESHLSGKRAMRLHLGEIFLEIAIVLSSLAILTRRALYWYVGIASSVLGAVLGASVLLIQH
jgi:hypothetical protein